MSKKDFLSIGISVLSLAITVIWNLSNRRHTDRVAKQLRADAFDLDEWKGHRSEILRTLRAFEASAARLAVLSRGAHDRDALIVEINAEAQALTHCHLALLRELERGRLDQDWVAIGYGSVEAGESDWDRLNSTLGELGEIADAGTIRTQLVHIEERSNSIAAVINEEKRIRNAEHTPARI